MDTKDVVMEDNSETKQSTATESTTQTDDSNENNSDNKNENKEESKTTDSVELGQNIKTNESDDNELDQDQEKKSEDEDNADKALESLDESGFDKDLPGFESLEDRQFTCDSDFATLVRQMVSDIPLQRLVSTKQLVPSAPRFGPKAMKSLIPRIKAIAGDKEIVIRQTLATQIGGIAEYFHESLSNKESHDVIIKDLLPLIGKMLLDNVEVRQAASKSLVHIAKLLNATEIHEHVLKIVLHLAHDEMDEHKITALPILGDLAPVVGASICANYLASDLHALSQDNSFRVRKATVQVFGPVCAQMGPEKTESSMLDLYHTLASDNIWSVRKGCVESIVDISKAVNPKTRVKLVALMKKFLEDTSRWVRNTAYEFLGPFLATLSSEQISTEFLKSFTQIPKLKSAE
eukprot:UN23835